MDCKTLTPRITASLVAHPHRATSDASTFSRSSGSVLLGRTLTHQSVTGDRQPVEPVLRSPVGERRRHLVHDQLLVGDEGVDLAGPA